MSDAQTPRTTEKVADVLNRVIATVGDSTSSVDWYERLLAVLDAKDAEIQRLREEAAWRDGEISGLERRLNQGYDAEVEVQRLRDALGEIASRYPTWSAGSVARAALSRSDTPGEAG